MRWGYPYVKHQLKEQGQLTTLKTQCPTFRASVWVLYNAKDARDGAMVYYPYREGLNVLIIYRYHWKWRQHCILLSYFKTISVSVVWAQTPDLKHGSLEISNWANQAVVILLTRLIRHIQQLLELSTFWFCYFYFQKKFFSKREPLSYVRQDVA